MAYTKVFAIRARLDDRVKYAVNGEKTELDERIVYTADPEKTDTVRFVTTLNCRSAETAFAAMQKTKKKYKKTGGVLGYHFIQSFAPGEVTPEQAHEIGCEFARRLFGEDFEAVIGTHLDKAHPHNHIVVNSVSRTDGHKYHSSPESYYNDVRGTSDALCRENDLSVITPQGKGKHYAEWKAEQGGKPTVRGVIRTDIDAIIHQAYTYDTFLMLLRKNGYEVRRSPNRKYTTVKPPGAKRAIRLDSLGEGYTEADNLEQLDQDTEALQAIGRARGCQFNILRYQQEDALNTVLPLGLKRIDATRTLTTECTAVLMPFKSQEIQDAGGIYYGVNAVSHNLIVCNRGNLLNGNGFITGVSGSGKSMAAKQEVSALALSTDHDIIIVDPEREYGELVRALGGEVITISASDPNGCHINALDLSEGYGDGREPLVMKSEFIMSLYEQLMGADKIEPQEKSIIDRSVGNIYREYIKNFQGQPPTLKDLYDDLMKQVNPEAHRIALALELFTVGSLNVFSHQTNINTKSRILCFDIQDLGENLKSVGLLVMLDAIYNRVIQNRREGKYTHVYIDEIYLFFANGSGSGHSITNYSSEFLYKCWKRFRKYGATLTGITQNVEECLLSNTARMMFANSEFLLMLNQATTDREQLARLLGASDTQMSYVDNAPAGHGLIKVGGAIVPFANELPKNTELYRLMSTRPGED